MYFRIFQLLFYIPYWFRLGMAIFARPAGTRSGSTLMDWVLTSPIRNRVRYGFLKKKPEAGPGWVWVL